MHLKKRQLICVTENKRSDFFFSQANINFKSIL